MVVPQLDPNLSNPIDRDAPPTIYGSKLKPELATAALNLSIDFLKQKESIANHYLATHMYTLSTLALAVMVYGFSKLNLPKGNFQSVTAYLVSFASLNRRELSTVLIVLCMVSSMLITSLAKVSASVFKTKTSAIVDYHGANVFGVDLNKLAAEDIDDTQEELLENTHVVIYRETPIALVSIEENSLLSTRDTLVMNINSLGCRRVYLKSGILDDLLDWALVRTKNYQQSFKKYKTEKSMRLLIEVYSFDTSMRDTIAKKGFSLVENVKMPESRLLGGLFGIRKELWGVQFHFEPKSEGAK